MSNDKSKRDDWSKVNLHDSHEVEYWTKKWSVSREQLTKAVEQAGSGAEAVAKALGKSST